MKQPAPRRGVYELYWKFAFERQRAFENRFFGRTEPWSEDCIINEYKFCNVFRAADRVSQYLIRSVCYSGDDGTSRDQIFRIVAFRLFSKIDTWDAVVDHLGGQPVLDDLASNRFAESLEFALAQNKTIYTGAFILCANDFYGKPYKYLNHVELLRHMFIVDDLASAITSASSLRQVYDELHSYPLIGDFMAYQIAVDLNYSDLLDFDEDDFTQPGPGALRGIRKCFEDLNGMSPAEIIMWMVEHQEAEFARLGFDFNGLFGRRLHAIDCQGLFCETDKYCRVATPHLESARKRIKAKFAPNSEGIDYFFPPKWDINDAVQMHRRISVPVDMTPMLF